MFEVISQECKKMVNFPILAYAERKILEWEQKKKKLYFPLQLCQIFLFVLCVGILRISFQYGFPVQSSLALNFQCACLSLPSAKITSMHHHIQLSYVSFLFFITFILYVNECTRQHMFAGQRTICGNWSSSFHHVSLADQPQLFRLDSRSHCLQRDLT